MDTERRCVFLDAPAGTFSAGALLSIQLRVETGGEDEGKKTKGEGGVDIK